MSIGDAEIATSTPWRRLSPDWLNGEKIVDYELGSDDWKRKVAESKFASMPRYGTLSKGHIALQDHGDRVRFRNIKIREAPGAE